MTNEENLSRLQARQLELLALMGKSDAHAAKCAKLGVKFSDEYPDELKEYEAANAEYNSNEDAISALKMQVLAESEVIDVLGIPKGAL
jgi:hypothetical protein